MNEDTPQKTSIAEAITAIGRFYQAGNLNDAERLCEAVLGAEPDHHEALRWAGLIAHRQGDPLKARALLDRAQKTEPTDASVYVYWGAVEKSLDNTGGAIENYKKAMALDPDLFDAPYNLGVAYEAAGKTDAALETYLKALEIMPDHLGTLVNLGSVCAELELYDQAIRYLQQALELKPDHADACINLGNIYQALGEHEKAEACFRRGLDSNPNLANVWSSLGSVVRSMGRLEEARDLCSKATRLDPLSPIAHNNLGLVHIDLSDFEAATSSFKRALTINPELAEAHDNLGTAYKMVGNLEQALDQHKRALELNPDSPPAAFNLSLAYLLRGNLQSGYDLYHWRWKNQPHKLKWREFPQPMWDGSDLNGKTLLVWGEQGLGDEIVFASLYRDLIARGAHCIFACDPRLIPLFERSFDQARIYPNTVPAHPDVLSPDIDFQCPAGALMKWLLPDFSNGEKREAYLVPDQGLVSKLQDRYRKGGGKKVVGLGWMTEHPSIKWQYNFPTDIFDNLLKTPGVQFVCLQYGDHHQEIENIYERTGVRVLQDNEINPLQDFDRFAAQEAAMDLVISVVNSTAVTASAIGVPVWGVLPAVSEWRWGNEGDTCRWYPSMKIFRSPLGGDWSDVSNAMTAAFEDWARE